MKSSEEIKFVVGKDGSEYVDGLMGVNKIAIGKHLNHEHFCEIKLLGSFYGLSEKEIQKWCPGHLKYKCMNSFEDCCDKCIHNRRVDLSDDGNHITNLKDVWGEE